MSFVTIKIESDDYITATRVSVTGEDSSEVEAFAGAFAELATAHVEAIARAAEYTLAQRRPVERDHREPELLDVWVAEVSGGWWRWVITTPAGTFTADGSYWNRKPLELACGSARGEAEAWADCREALDRWVERLDVVDPLSAEGVNVQAMRAVAERRGDA